MHRIANFGAEKVAVRDLVYRAGPEQKLVLDKSMESSQLVDALCAKSDAAYATVTAPKMLRVALTLAAARLIVRFLDEKGDAALVAVAKAMAT